MCICVTATDSGVQKKVFIRAQMQRRKTKNSVAVMRSCTETMDISSKALYTTITYMPACFKRSLVAVMQPFLHCTNFCLSLSLYLPPSLSCMSPGGNCIRCWKFFSSFSTALSRKLFREKKWHFCVCTTAAFLYIRGLTDPSCLKSSR